MILLVKPEETQRGACAWRQRDSGGLNCGAGKLMLKPFARQVRAERKTECIGVAKARPEKLLSIGRKAVRAVKASMHDERMQPILRQVLAAHHDRPVALMTGNVMVDILRGVGLVVHEEATVAEA